MGRFYQSQKLTPGYRLLRPLQDRSGRILLQSGTVLTERYLELIEQWGLEDILLLAESPSKEASFSQVKRTHVIDIALQTVIIDILADVFTNIVSEKALPVDRLRHSALLLVREIMTHQQVALDLSALRTLDENTFNHSLSVAVFAIAAGVELGLGEPALMELAIGALLHDIGKTKISPAIINKPGRLSAAERAIIEQHPRWGVELLQEKGGFEPSILQGIYQHHERSDGSGYPFGLHNGLISQLGQITAVADFYDAMTSDRAYRAGQPAYLVVEQLIASSLTLFDAEVVWAFIRSLAPYPIGSRVLLDNGEHGEVVGYDRRMPNRPRVLVTHDVADQALAHPFECDLLQQLDRFIIEVG